MVMLGTKCPSMTSTWIQSAPAASIARTSSPSLAKSAERIEGAIRTGCCMTPCSMAASSRKPVSGGSFEAGDEEAVAIVGHDHAGEGADLAQGVGRDAGGQFFGANRV